MASQFIRLPVAGGGGGGITSINGDTTAAQIIQGTADEITTASFGGTTTIALAPTTVTPGSYGPADITVDAFGRITAAYNASPSGVTSLNTLTGDLTLAAGTNITITPSGGNTLTIDASGGGGLWAEPSAGILVPTNIGDRVGILTSNIDAPLQVGSSYAPDVSYGAIAVGASNGGGSNREYLMQVNPSTFNFEIGDNNRYGFTSFTPGLIVHYDTPGLIEVPGTLKASGLIYPTTDGSPGYVMTTDGAGNLSMQPGGGGGGLTITPYSMSDNQTIPTTVFSVAQSNAAIWVKYQITRNGDVEMGEMNIVNNGTNATYNRVINAQTAYSGVTFSTILAGGNVILRYVSTSTGFNPTMKYSKVVYE